MKRRSILDDDFVQADDDDVAIESAGDVCERCDCSRSRHEDDGKGACACGRCKRFKEAS